MEFHIVLLGLMLLCTQLVIYCSKIGRDDGKDYP